MSAGLWRMMGEEAVGVVTVLGPWRTVRREAQLKKKKKLHFTFHLPSQSGISGESRELMWGKTETPIHVFPQMTELLTRKRGSISIHSPVRHFVWNCHEGCKWW